MSPPGGERSIKSTDHTAAAARPTARFFTHGQCGGLRHFRRTGARPLVMHQDLPLGESTPHLAGRRRTAPNIRGS